MFKDKKVKPHKTKKQTKKLLPEPGIEPGTSVRQFDAFSKGQRDN